VGKVVSAFEDAMDKFSRSADAFARSAARVEAIRAGGRQKDCGCVIGGEYGCAILAPCEGCYQFGQFIEEGERIMAKHRGPSPGVRWAGD
jgi:hypothetical protein